MPTMSMTELTARMQDIINGLRDGKSEQVAFGWMMQDDGILRLITPVLSPYTLANGEVATPDTLVISTWDLPHNRREADFLIENPIPIADQTLDSYAQAILSSAQAQVQGHVIQSGVSHDNTAVTVTDPSTLHPLRTGWQEATEIGIRDATKYVPDIVRLSFLQSQVGSHTIPMTWALEENGRDLHVITWYPSDDPTRAHAELKHYQYELVDGMPRSELIHVVTNLRISPGNLTEERLAVSSQRILDWYQRKGRYPTTEFTDLPDWKPPTYTQADMMLHGGTPTLTYQGEPVPSWAELERQAALSYLQGRNLDLRNIYTAQQKNNDKKKGSIMVDQLDKDTQQIMIHIDNNESLMSSIESYAVGLEAMQAPQQTQIKTNDSVPAVANMIVSRAVQKLQEEDLAQGADLRVYSDEVLASARQEVSDRIIENAQYLRDEKLSQTPQQTQKVDTGKKSEKSFPKVNVPHQFVHPYQMHTKDGRTFDKAIINIPDGVKLNGIDVSGYSVDRFMNKNMQEDKANGRPVTLSFAPDKPVSIFRGQGSSRETITIDDPWILCKAIKAERDAYKQAHTQKNDNTGPDAQTVQKDQPPSFTPQNPDAPDVNLQAKELALYTQNTPTIKAAIEQVTQRAVHQQAAGTYDEAHTLEVMQRVTDKAASLSGKNYTPEAKQVAAQIVLSESSELIQSPQARDQNLKDGMTAKPPIDQEKTSEPSDRNTFLAGLVQKTDNKLAQTMPSSSLEHTRGVR